ncbi:MAG: MAPEG family protein [Pseudomonadota bacterium]
MVTGLYAGLAALFLVFLSVRVIRVRQSQKISVGTAGNPDMERAMRVQANFVEYTPLLIVMLGIAEMNGLHPHGVNTIGALIIIARIAHFIGFATEAGPMAGRVAGTILTFLLLIASAGVLIAQFLGVI